VNPNGTFYCTSAAEPAMINQRFGRIINIGSVVGQMGAFSQADYAGEIALDHPPFYDSPSNAGYAFQNCILPGCLSRAQEGSPD